MTMNEHPLSDDGLPVDAVIAWVDGNDPVLAAKRNSYLNGKTPGITSGAHSTRFASVNEIRYCVLSILRFAPFIRNIFIVTDNQDPGLDEDLQTFFPEKRGSVKIVDHREIFEGFEKYLPTFNSISIASMIWRIRGLAQNFIYFNDDSFLVRPVSREDFFIGGKPVIRGRWVPAPVPRVMFDRLRKFIHRRLLNDTDFQLRASFHIGQWNSAALLGFRCRYFTNSHTPHTVDRKTVEEFFGRNRELLEKNISCRFRDYSQFTFISLSNHLQLLEGNRLIRKPDFVYLKPANHRGDYIGKKIRFCEESPDIKFLCAQSLDLCSTEEQDKLFGWLDDRLQLQQAVG
jgi:hypothetical protein